ncbi:hypothetical protein Dpep_0401 [Dethiosulfovibrio peptidovorans DSM 11002]|uniref:HTH cro/C1-type domain-containing protein n=1 Tax=Dethiosulfovibrio peptidovorans DSM 11002 TaxID=469381 RepID=D2Z4A4_9BACT|nr:helix-turn-helix transcriptional regulator [Dethiosulfovibrio peptidovorans]EFC90433.1 hypothetical protein Dpep_0401 [Dethiosulfovibrio peptidovorans DSM 11002]
MKCFPAYRRYRLNMGIGSDRELSRKAGLAEQRVSLWLHSRPLRGDEAEKLAAFLGCEATDIWDRETGRPIPAA